MNRDLSTYDISQENELFGKTCSSSERGAFCESTEVCVYVCVCVKGVSLFSSRC